MLRSKLREIIATACDRADVAPEAKVRLVAAADGIDKILIGEYFTKVEGEDCGCPVTLAGYFIPGGLGWNLGWTDEAREHNVGLFPVLFDGAPEFRRSEVERWAGVEFVRITD